MKSTTLPDCNNNTEEPQVHKINESVAQVDLNDISDYKHRWPRILKSRVRFDPPTKSLCLARELIDAFERHSERVLLVDSITGQEWTGAKLLDAAGRVACGLNKLVGIRPNDVGMIICQHNVEETLVALGIILAGGALYGVSMSDGFEENKSLCEIVRPRMIVVSSQWREQVDNIKAQVSGLDSTSIVWSNECTSNSGELSVEQLLKHKLDRQLLDVIADELVDPSKHVSTYMLTSGSTGRPKVVPTTHSELVYGLYSLYSATKNSIGSNDAVEPNPFERLEDYNNEYLLPITPDDSLAGDLPLDHGAGLNTMFLSFYVGSKFVRIPAYDVDAFWQSVSDFGITVSVASTTFGFKLLTRLKQLIDSDQTDKYDITKLKFMTCCGAKLAYQSLADEVCRTYSNLNVSQAYGCTEIGFISMVPMRDSRTHRQAVGFVFPGVECKLAQRTNRPADANECTERLVDEPGTRGELLVWARSKFKGYMCHPDELDKAESIYKDCHVGRFYRSGDQTHFDRAGRLYIHGRFKDTLFLREDWKIMPAELEQVVDQHPLVEQSAVVGLPDPDLPGCDAPKAFCRLIQIGSSCHAELLSGMSTSENLRQLVRWLEAGEKNMIASHIYDFVASKTAEPKHLRGGVYIVDDFPRVGLLRKVDRKVLKGMMQRDD